MVKLKYADGVTPLRNEHCGCTFQNSRIGQTAMSGQKNDRERQSRQMNKKANLMQAVTNWRNLTFGSKQAWTDFATNYPQPTKADPTKFLTGYQLFIKRQQYLFLNEGIRSEFMEAPFSEVLTLENFSFSIDQTENCLDVTEPYIRNFGLIPSAGQFMLIKVLPYSVKSGQFFPVVTQTIETLESYMDGLFVSLHLPVNLRDTVFSVYLSKPVNQSVVYGGTKTRYMGCFTTKTFLGLTDTPDSYEGQAGKNVRVKADESGLEFYEENAGGLTCETLSQCIVIEEMNNAIDDLIDQVANLETNQFDCSDLPECPTIISINNQIDTLAESIVVSGNTSIPSVKYADLFNWYAAYNADSMAPIGWHLPTKTDIETTRDFLGGYTVAGGKMKEIGTTYFTAPNTGATNSSKFNARGSGRRYFDGSAYNSFGTTFYMWLATLEFGLNPYCAQLINGTTGMTIFSLARNWACSVRFVKDTTTLTDGQSSFVYGLDGKLYRTICIGTKEWMADSSRETMFRSGALIPVVTDPAAWGLLTTAGKCYANGLPSNS